MGLRRISEGVFVLDDFEYYLLEQLLPGSSDLIPPDAELINVETYALSPITSSTGLKGVLLDVIGPYDNIVTQFTYRQNSSTNLSYVNEVTPDYPWIASAALFIVLVFSLFSLLKRSFSSWLK